MSSIVYPLTFSKNIPEVSRALEANPGCVVDVGTTPAYLLPICNVCHSGQFVAREEMDDKTRYFCAGCGKTTSLQKTQVEAMESWINSNLPDNH